MDGAAEAMSSLSAAGEGAEPEEATVDSATSDQQQPKKASRAQKRRVSVFSSLGLFPCFDFYVVCFFVFALLASGAASEVLLLHFSCQQSSA